MHDWSSANTVFWLSMAATALGGAALVFIGLVRDLLRRTRGPRCPRCWYDLRGAVEAGPPDGEPWRIECPECGRVMTKRRQMHRARRRWRVAVTGMLLLAMHVYGYEVWHRVDAQGEPWRTAWVPSTILLLAMSYTEAWAFQLSEDRNFNTLKPVSLFSSNGPRFWCWQRRLYVRALSEISTDARHPAQGLALFRLYRTAQLDDDRAALDYFLEQLHHENADIRRTAAELLGNMGYWSVADPDRVESFQKVYTSLRERRRVERDPAVAETLREKVYAIQLVLRQHGLPLDGDRTPLAAPSPVP